MMFARLPRFEPLTMTARRVAAFSRKQEKERARYPLFQAHVANEQSTLDTETTKRQRLREKSEADLRDFHAGVWRSARALYFQQPTAVREQIRAAWLVWTGPRTSTYFSSMVDGMSGERDRRLERIRIEQAPFLAAARARLRQGVTESLFQE